MSGIDEHTGIETLDPEECWRLLERHEVGRLAVAIANRPDIFPVNYALDRRGSDRRAIFVQTAPGTKLAAAVLGDAVAFEVDALDVRGRTGWSVVARGRAEEIVELGERLAAEDLGMPSWSDHEKDRFIRIIVDDLTGRRLA